MSDAIPSLNPMMMRDYLLQKYKDNPAIADMFTPTGVLQYIDRRVQWEDMGIHNPFEQQELEKKLNQLIQKVTHDNNARRRLSQYED